MTALTLVRNETIKTTRRPAFWVITLAFAGIMTIMMLELQGGDGPAVGFPDIWAKMLGEIGPLAPFFGAILLILLVTGEFSFRTARQNVIDGLSKEAWFGGKLLLVPGVAAGFIALSLGIGALAASAGGVDGGILRSADLAILAGYATGVVTLLAGAFMAAMLVRGSGAAMATFFFYITLLEQLIVLGIARMAPEAGPLLRFAPFRIVTNLLEPAAFDPAVVARAAARAAEANQPFEPEVFMQPGVLIAAGAAWTVFFVATAFVAFRKRDL